MEDDVRAPSSNQFQTTIADTVLAPEINLSKEAETMRAVEKPVLTEDETSNVVETNGEHIPFSATAENTTTEVAQTNSSILVETAMETPQAKAVLEKPNCSSHIDEEIKNEIHIENEIKNENQLKNEQEATEEIHKLTEGDLESEVKTADTIVQLERKEGDDNSSELSSSSEANDHILERTNEQNLVQTEASSKEVEATEEDRRAKSSDFSIDDPGASSGTTASKDHLNDDKLKGDNKLAQEAMPEEENANEKSNMQSHSAEIDGKTTETSSKSVSESQHDGTNIKSEKTNLSPCFESESENLNAIKEREHYEEASVISELEKAPVLPENEKIHSINSPGSAFEASEKVLEEQKDIGSANATENFDSKAFDKEECIEKHLDSNSMQLKLVLAEANCREKISEENPQAGLRDVFIAAISPDSNIQNDEMESITSKETNISACDKNVIQNTEEQIHERGESASNTLQGAQEDEKIEESAGDASDENSLDISSNTTTHDQDEKSQETLGIESEKCIDSSNTNTKCQNEDNVDLPMSQASAEENPQYNDSEGSEPEKATAMITEERTVGETKNLDVTSDEISLRSNHEEVKCEKADEACNVPSENSTVDESKNEDKKSPAEDTIDVLPVVQTLVQESFLQDELSSDKAHEAKACIYEEKSADIKEFDLSSDKNIQEVNCTSLNQEIKCENDEQVSSAVDEHHITNGSDNEEKKPFDAPPMNTLLQEGFQEDKVQINEAERVNESITEEKAVIESSDQASEEKILAAEDRNLQHRQVEVPEIEDASNVVSGGAAVKGCLKTDKENPEDEIGDALPVVQTLIESLQESEASDDKDEKMLKQTSEEETVEKIKTIIDGSDTAVEEKSDASPVERSSAEEGLEMDKIQNRKAEKRHEPRPEEAENTASEEKILEANDENSEYREIKRAKVEEHSYPIAEVDTVDEREGENKVSPAEQTTDVLPVVEALYEKSLLTDESQCDDKETTEKVSEEKTAEETKVSEFESEEKNQEAKDAVLPEKQVERRKVEGNSGTDFPEDTESKNPEDENATEANQDVLPASQNLGEERMQTDEIEHKESHIETKHIYEEQTLEVTREPIFANDKEVHEASGTGSQKGEVEFPNIIETSVSKLPTDHESHTAVKQEQPEDRINVSNTTPAFGSEMLQNCGTQCNEPERAPEPIVAEKIEAQAEISEFQLEHRCSDVIQTHLQNEHEGVDISETKTSVSEISTLDDGKNSDDRTPIEAKEDTSRPVEPIVEESLHNAQIHKKELEIPTELMSEEKIKEVNDEKALEAREIDLQKEETEDSITAEGPLVSEFPAVDESDDAEKQKPPEDRNDASDTQDIEPEQGSKPVVAEKIERQAATSDFPSEESCLHVIDTNLQHEHGGVEIDETKHSVSEISTLDDIENSDDQTSIEDKADTSLPVEPIVEEILHNAQIHKKELEIPTELMSEEKIKEVNDEKALEAREIDLQKEETEDSNSLEKALVSELPAADERNNTQDIEPEPASKQVLAKKIEVQAGTYEFPSEETCLHTIVTNLQHEPEGVEIAKTKQSVSEIFTLDDVKKLDDQITTEDQAGTLPPIQPIVKESLHNAEIHSKELERPAELTPEEKIKEVNDEKALEASEIGLQKEEAEDSDIAETSLVSELPAIEESGNVEKQNLPEDREDVSDATQQIEPQMSEPLLAEKIEAQVRAPELPSDERYVHVVDTPVHHEDSVEISQISTLDEIKNSDEQTSVQDKADTSPPVQPIVEESSENDEIHIKGHGMPSALMSEEKNEVNDEKVCEASETGLQKVAAEDLNIARTSSLTKLPAVDESGNEVEQNQSEERIDVSNVSQESPIEIFQKSETQQVQPETASEPTPAVKIKGQIETCELSSKERFLDVIDACSQHEHVDLDIEETTQSVSEVFILDKVKNSDEQTPMVDKADTMPSVEPIVDESLRKDVIQDKEPETTSELTSEEKIKEVNNDKALEANEIVLQKEEAKDSNKVETSSTISELPTVDESDNAVRQNPPEDQIDVSDAAQAMDSDTFQENATQNVKPENPGSAPAEMIEAQAGTSEFPSEEKCPDVIDTQLQHHHEGVEIVETIQSVSEISIMEDITHSDERKPVEDKAEILPPVKNIGEESFQNDEIQSEELAIPAKLTPIEKTEMKDEKVIKESQNSIQKEDVEGSNITETSTSVSRLPAIDESDNPESQNLPKDREDASDITQSCVEPETVPEPEILEKLETHVEASESLSEDKCLDVMDTKLQHKHEDMNIAKTTQSVFVEVNSSDEHIQVEERADTSAFVEPMVEENLQNDEIHRKETVPEPAIPEKLEAQVETPESLSEDKCLDVIDTNLQHKHEDRKIAQTTQSVSDEVNNSHEQMQVEETADTSAFVEPIVEESLQIDEIHRKETVPEPAILEKLEAQVETSESLPEENCLDVIDTNLQHKHEDIKIAKTTQSVSEEVNNSDDLPQVEETADTSAFVEPIVEESLQIDEIHSEETEITAEFTPEEKIKEVVMTTDLSSQDKILEANDLEPEVKKLAESVNKSIPVVEVDNAEKESPEEKADALPGEQTFVEKGLQKVETQVTNFDKEIETISEEMIVEENKASRFAPKEKNVKASHSSLQHKQAKDGESGELSPSSKEGLTEDKIHSKGADTEAELQSEGQATDADEATCETEEPIEPTDMSSEDIKAESTGKEEILGEKSYEFKAAQTCEIAKDEKIKQEKNLETSVSIQTLVRVYVQNEVQQKVDQDTVKSEVTGEHPDENIQKESQETSLETASMENVEEMQNQVDKVPELKRELQVSESKEDTEISVSETLEEENESKERISTSLTVLNTQEKGPPTDDKIEDKLEETLRIVLEDQDTKETDSSSTTENATTSKDGPYQINISSQTEETEVVHEYHVQNESHNHCADNQKDEHDEPSKTLGQVEEELKKNTSEEIDSEKDEKAIDHEFSVKDAETSAGNEPTIVESSEDAEESGLKTSVEDKTEKGGDHLMEVEKDTNGEPNNKANEQMEICKTDGKEELTMEATLHIEQDDKVQDRSSEFQDGEKLSEVPEACQTSTMETPNDNESSKFTSQDILAGENNQSLHTKETETAGATTGKEKSYIEEKVSVKTPEACIPDVNPVEVKKGTDKLAQANETSENTPLSEENLGTSNLSKNFGNMESKDESILGNDSHEISVTNTLEETNENREETNDVLPNDNVQLEISKTEYEPDSAAKDQNHESTWSETTRADGLPTSLAPAEESLLKEALPKNEENVRIEDDTSESKENALTIKETSANLQRNNSKFDQLEKTSDPIPRELKENEEQEANVESIENTSSHGNFSGEENQIHENKELKHEVEHEREAEDQSCKAKKANDFINQNEEEKPTDMMFEEDKRKYSIEKTEPEAFHEGDTSDTLNDSLFQIAEESTVIEVGEKHQEATSFTHEDDNLNKDENINFDVPMDTETKPKENLESVSDKEIQENAAENSMENECSVDAMPSEQADMQKEAIKKQTEEAFKEQYAVSTKPGERNEDVRTEKEKLEKLTLVPSGGVEAASADESVDKEINTAFVRDLEARDGPENIEGTRVEEAAPEPKHEVSLELKEVNSTTEYESKNEVCKGREEGTAQELKNEQEPCHEFENFEERDKKELSDEISSENNIVEANNRHDNTEDENPNAEEPQGPEHKGTDQDISNAPVGDKTENLGDEMDENIIREAALNTENKFFEKQETLDANVESRIQEVLKRHHEAAASELNVSTGVDKVESLVKYGEEEKLGEPVLNAASNRFEMKGTPDDTEDENSNQEGSKGLGKDGMVEELKNASVEVGNIEEEREDNKLIESELNAEHQMIEIEKSRENMKIESHNKQVPKSHEEGAAQELSNILVAVDQNKHLKEEWEEAHLNKPDLNTENCNFEVKETHEDEIQNKEVTNRIGEGSIQELKKDSVFFDKVQSHEEDKENKKPEESKLNAENKIFEIKETDEYNKDKIPNEEVPKGLEREGATQICENVSVVVHDFEALEEEREDKHTAKNQTFEIEDKLGFTRESPNAKDTRSSLLSTERSYQTGPVEKMEAAVLEEQVPIPRIDVSNVAVISNEESAKELHDKLESGSNLALEKQIHEATTVNKKNREFATSEKSSIEGCSEAFTNKDSTKTIAPISIEASGVTDVSPPVPLSDVRTPPQESKELHEPHDSALEKMNQDMIHANEIKGILLTMPKEASCLPSSDHVAEEKQSEKGEPQDSCAQRHKTTKAKEIEDIAIKNENPLTKINGVSATQATEESGTTEVSDLSSQSEAAKIVKPISETELVSNEQTYSTAPARKQEVFALKDHEGPISEMELMSNEKTFITAPASKQKEVFALKDHEGQNKSYEIPLAEQYSGEEVLEKQSTQKLEGDQETQQNTAVPKEVSNEISNENSHTTEEYQRPRIREASEVKHEEASQVEISKMPMRDEVEDSTKEVQASEVIEVRLLDLLQDSPRKSLQTAEHFVEDKNMSTEEQVVQNKLVEAAFVIEEKTDEEKNADEEHKKEEPSCKAEALVIVEASKDAELKPSHKKSHNILSGVGSKVKHSLSKVKKAITGKSSHPKSLPPNS